MMIIAPIKENTIIYILFFWVPYFSKSSQIAGGFVKTAHTALRQLPAVNLPFNIFLFIYTTGCDVTSYFFFFFIFQF